MERIGQYMIRTQRGDVCLFKVVDVVESIVIKLVLSWTALK